MRKNRNSQEGLLENLTTAWSSNKSGDYFCEQLQNCPCDELGTYYTIQLNLLIPFTGPKMFWAGPNFLCQTQHLFTYFGSHKRFVPDKKVI